MNHQWHYGWETLSQAVSALATGDGPLADRLTNACFPALSGIQQANLPPELWDRFVDVKGDLFPSHGTLAEHIHKLPADWLHRSASELVSLYDSICRLMPR